MTYSVAQAKADLEGVLHGTTTNQITNLDGIFWRAARQVLLDCDPQETKRITALPGTVFNSVYDYACPADLKGNRVVDIRPQVNRFVTEQFLQQYNERFDATKLTSQLNTFTINFNTSLKTIRMGVPSLPAPTHVNDATTITANGTWVVGGNATTIANDSINYVAGSSAIKFNISAGGSSAYLENTTSQSVDLSTLLNEGTLFLYTYLPTATDFTNVKLRWGSSSTAYYEVTATQTQAQTAFQNGWNLLAFPWLGATVTGSPDSTDITYLRVTWTYNGTAQTSVRLNQISAILGSIFEMEYYSNCLFRTAGGTFQESVTDDSNLINLATESYNLLLYKVAELAVQQQQGVDAMLYDGQYFSNLYLQTLRQYNQMYPSEAIKPQNNYYGVRKPRFRPSRYGW